MSWLALDSQRAIAAEAIAESENERQLRERRLSSRRANLRVMGFEPDSLFEDLQRSPAASRLTLLIAI
jgi:hypothetical protein